jgi:histidinol-phosphate phosphatase family protein
VPEQLNLIPGTEQAIRRLNNSEYRVCVITNQPVIARGECSLSTMRQIHNKLETQLGKHGAYVDRISYCPHHPEKGFLGEVPEFKIDCECRKPKTGMIDTAVNDLNIDINASWLIGDTSTDILTAKRSGIRSILVETGYAGFDQKHWVTPNYVHPNFSSAVNFIIDIHPRIMDELTPQAIAIKPASLVLIGGHSRSGKSSYASALKERLLQLGKTSHVISTDRWLLCEDKRNKGVIGRHNLKELTAFMQTISNKKRPYSISIPGYNKIKRTQVQDVELLIIKSQDIIILEGVVALSLAEIFSSALRIFIKVDESIRRTRVIREYMLRGLNEKAAKEVYEARLIDEFNFVVKLEKIATSVHDFSDFTSECNS